MKDAKAIREYRDLVKRGLTKEEAAKQACYRWGVSRATLDYHLKVFGDEK